MSDISIRFKIKKDELDDLYQVDYKHTLRRYQRRFGAQVFILLASIGVFLAADYQYSLHKLGWWIPILIIMSIFAISRILRLAGFLGRLKNLDDFLSAYRFKKWHGKHLIKINKKQFEYRRDGKRKAIYEWDEFKELKEHDTYLRLEWGEQAPPPIKDWENKAAVIISIQHLKPDEVELIKEKIGSFRPKYRWDEKLAYYKML
ncbi:MAG: hypothetical protein AAF927_23670 [Bacteroidota bacterium]